MAAMSVLFFNKTTAPILTIVDALYRWRGTLSISKAYSFTPKEGVQTLITPHTDRGDAK